MLVFDVISNTIVVVFDVIPGKWHLSEISIFYKYKMSLERSIKSGISFTKFIQEFRLYIAILVALSVGV